MADLARSPEIKQMTKVVASIFSEINIGLFIYHLEDPAEPRSLRLVYANEAASECTGAELGGLVGKTIIDAFPGLIHTDLPEAYAEVLTTERSRNMGSFEYAGDEHVGSGHFAVKAFPMPHDCVGIAFENITARKKVDELVKKEREAGHR